MSAAEHFPDACLICHLHVPHSSEDCGYNRKLLPMPPVTVVKVYPPSDPTCRCGKPGAWRGDRDGQSPQVMRCADCCAAEAVEAALERNKPPAFVTLMKRDIEAAGQALRCALEKTSMLGYPLSSQMQAQIHKAMQETDEAQILLAEAGA